MANVTVSDVIHIGSSNLAAIQNTPVSDLHLWPHLTCVASALSPVNNGLGREHFE